ncbi:MAG: hypothetical protein HKN01_06400 [Acidimicrobiia bacterium]|nr:hypothetical protein [Acidimicrobiia bacterium]
MSVDTGSGWIPAVDDTLVTFSFETNDASAFFVGGINTCLTTGGTCDVTINAPDAGLVVVSATTDVNVEGEILTRTTGTAGNGDNAVKTYEEPPDLIVVKTNDANRDGVFTDTESTGWPAYPNGFGNEYYEYRFSFADGTVIEGWSETNEASIAGFGDTFHLSCSDDFGFFKPGLPDGFGEKGSPLPGETPLVGYDIVKHKDGRIDTSCGWGGTLVTFKVEITAIGADQLITDVIDDIHFEGFEPATWSPYCQDLEGNPIDGLIPADTTVECYFDGLVDPRFVDPANYDDKNHYRFVDINGVVYEGTTDSGDLTLPGYSDGIHMSCSDEFGFGDSDPTNDGYGESGSPLPGEVPFASYSIVKVKNTDGEIEKTCGGGTYTENNTVTVTTDPEGWDIILTDSDDSTVIDESGPLPPNCDLCAFGDPTAIVMTYTGGTCAVSNNTQGDKGDCADGSPAPGTVWILASDDANPYDSGASVFFSGEVSLDEAFTMAGSFSSNTYLHVMSGDPSLGFVTEYQLVQLHTSCSADLIEGQIFGSLTLGDANAPDACPAPPPNCDLCADSDPTSIDMTVLGGSCGDSNNTQGDKTDCDDFGGTGIPGAGTVTVRVSNDSDPGNGTVFFEGPVDVGNAFTFSGNFSSNTYIHVFSGASQVQMIQLHTSCSADLIEGQQFGGLLLGDPTNPSSCLFEDTTGSLRLDRVIVPGLPGPASVYDAHRVSNI